MVKRPLKPAWKRHLARFIRDERGATMLEWCLLLAFIAIPVWVMIRFGLAILAAHYGLVTTMNQMPFP